MYCFEHHPPRSTCERNGQQPTYIIKKQQELTLSNGHHTRTFPLSTYSLVFFSTRFRHFACHVGNEFHGTGEPYCWNGDGKSEKVADLLASHIIHPNKLSSPVGVAFAETVNQPAVGVAFASQRVACATENAPQCLDHNEGVAMPFWCPHQR